MALLKEFTNQKGIKTTYHKIDSITIDSTNSLIFIYIKHYADMDYREEEKQHEEESTFIKQTVETIKVDNITSKFSIKKAYEMLKETEEYKDAEDV